MRLTAAAKSIIIAVLFFSALAPREAAAGFSSDCGVPLGHFYTQASGFPLETQKGYRITDEENIPFWTEFQQLGGVETLGYPISRRFFWDGYISQATQRGVLQWHPAETQMQLVNLLDYLSARGFDQLLEKVYSIPAVTPITNMVQGSADWQGVAQASSYLLEQSPAVRSFYLATTDPLRLYGFPTSPVVDVGP
jgi:hypothetical protein